MNEDGELAARLLQGRRPDRLRAGDGGALRPAAQPRARSPGSTGATASTAPRRAGAHPESMRRSHLLPPARDARGVGALADAGRAAAPLARGAAALRARARGRERPRSARVGRGARRRLRCPPCSPRCTSPGAPASSSAARASAVPVAAIRSALQAPPRPSARLRRASRSSDLEALREEWTALGERTGNLFATWEWNSLWWEQLGRGRRLLVAACRDERGALVGILPAYVAATAGPAAPHPLHRPRPGRPAGPDLHAGRPGAGRRRRCAPRCARGRGPTRSCSPSSSRPRRAGARCWAGGRSAARRARCSS